MVIKAVIFDYGGVLTQEGIFGPFTKVYAPKYGKDPKELFNVMIENWNETKLEESELFWIKCAEYLGISDGAFKKELLDFSGFREDVLELILKLKKNYKIGLLSNQVESWLGHVIKERELDKVFDAIIASYAVGLAKPNPTIYKLIIEKLGVKPEECVFVDDLEKNMPPAQELGMKTILFKDPEQMKQELRALGVST